MRSCVALASGMLALAGVASAQTPASASDADRGYVEGVDPVRVRQRDQPVVWRGGRVHGEAEPPGVRSRSERSATSRRRVSAPRRRPSPASCRRRRRTWLQVKQPVTFGVAGLKFIVPTSGSAAAVRAGRRRRREREAGRRVHGRRHRRHEQSPVARRDARDRSVRLLHQADGRRRRRRDVALAAARGRSPVPVRSESLPKTKAST